MQHYTLRPVGNAVVPLSDDHPLGALTCWAPLYLPQESLSIPFFGKHSATSGTGETRGSKFWVPSSENLELRTSNSPPSRLSRASLLTPYPSPLTVRPAGIDLSSVLDSSPPMAPSPQHSARNLLHKPSLFPAADPRFTFRASRFTVPLISILLGLLCLVVTACGTTGKILLDDPRGTVSLQTMSDQSIQATHPINLEPTILAKILRGIEIQEQEHGLQKYLSGPSSSVPVFSDDQIRFLAPLLAEGLRTATPDQRIEYLVQTTHEGSMLESSTTETTAGSLYAYGRLLYVILSQYRYSPTRTNLTTAGDMAYRSRPPDSSGLLDRIVLFIPRDAQRSDAFDPPEGGKSTDRFLAIDYQMLQHAPPAAATTVQTQPTRESPAGTSASEAPAHTTEALAQEVETLRKELQSVQQQLGSQTPKQDSPKRKTTPPSKKPQQTAP